MPGADEIIVEDYIRTEGDTFEILARIGEGGMGVVYKACQASMNRIVAIKKLHPQLAGHEQVQRLIKEAKSTALLEHPNIVRVYSFAIAENREPFIVMEYLEGETLDLVIERGALAIEQFYSTFNQVFAALEVAHASGVLHRDLKPANIFVTTGGAVKLMDFGIAKLLDTPSLAQSMTQTGAILGTPAYMSPEQCRGEKLDERSDIYSLGCVMFAALTGASAFQGESSLDIMYRQIHESPDLRHSKASQSLQNLIMRMMDKDPNARFQTSTDARQAFTQSQIDPWLQQTPSKGRSGSPSRIMARRKSLPLSLITLAVLAAAVVAMLSSRGLSPPRPLQADIPSDAMPAFRCLERGQDCFKACATAKTPEESRRMRQETITWYTRGLKQAQSANDKKMIADNSIGLAMMAYPIDSARYEDTLKLAEQSTLDYYGPQSRQALTMWNITGKVLRGAGQRKRAIAHYEKTLAISNSHDYGLDRVEALMNIGLTYEADLQFTVAAPYFQQVIKLAEPQAGRFGPTMIAAAQGEYGRCLKETGKLMESIGPLTTAIAMTKRLRDESSHTEQLITYYGALNSVYKDLKMTRQQEALLKEAVSYIKQASDIAPQQQEVCDQITDDYELTKPKS